MNEFWSASAVSRGRIVSVDDSGEHQRISVRGYAGESFSDVVRYQPHGFTSNPPADSVGAFLRLGESDRLVAMGYETPSRPRNVPGGGWALYDAGGKVIKSSPNDGLDWDAGGQDVTIRNARSVTITGSQEIAIGVAGRFIRIRASRIDFGVTSASGQATAKIMTDAGPSSVLYGVP